MMKMAKYQLGDICEIVSGSTPKTSVKEYWNGDIKWITPAELNDDTYVISDSARKITELAVRKTGLTPFPKGTVILSSRAPIGKVAIAGCEMYCNQGFKNLICSEKINNRYLYWFLKGNTVFLNSLGRGATFKEISKSIVSRIEINVPDIEKQIEVVEILETISDIIALRKQELFAMDELVSARFVEMFYEKGYPVLKWNDVFTTTTGKLDSNASDEKGTYPFFTCSKEVLRIDTFAFDQEALLLAGNNAAGKYDVKYYNGKFNAYQRTYVLSLKENWSYRLFQYQLEDKLEYLKQQSLGGLTKYLTLKILGELKFVIPPKELQSEFETFVEQVDKSKAVIEKELKKTQLLFDSLMQKYFG